MTWKENWGETFDEAPAWALAFAEFLCLPLDARLEATECATQSEFAKKWSISRSLLTMIQGEPEFQRLMRSMSDANGITEAHRRQVMENLFRLAAYGNDPRAIKTFMEVSGQLVPQATVQIDLTQLPDDEVERMLNSRLAAIPATATPKELSQ